MFGIVYAYAGVIRQGDMHSRHIAYGIVRTIVYCTCCIELLLNSIYRLANLFFSPFFLSFIETFEAVLYRDQLRRSHSLDSLSNRLVS